MTWIWLSKSMSGLYLMVYAPTLVGSTFSRADTLSFSADSLSCHFFLGVSGHATCGGFGPTSRMWGLFSDHIVELEVVIANGTIVKASEKTNTDLFFVRN